MIVVFFGFCLGFFTIKLLESCLWMFDAFLCLLSVLVYISMSKKKSFGFCRVCVSESEWFTADKYPTEAAVQEIDERQPWLHDLKFSMRPPK